MPSNRKPDVCFETNNAKSFAFSNNAYTLKLNEIRDKTLFRCTSRNANAGTVLTIDSDRNSDKAFTTYAVLNDITNIENITIAPADGVNLIWLDGDGTLKTGKNYIIQFRQISQTTVLASLTNTTLNSNNHKPQIYGILLELETTEPNETITYTHEQLHVDLSDVNLYWDYDPLTDTLGEETHDNEKTYVNPGIHYLVLTSRNSLKWPSLYNVETPKLIGKNLVAIKRYKEDFITTLIEKDAHNDFGSCRKLKYIEEGLNLIDENLENAGGLFYYCTALEELPHSLFKNCTNIKSFDMTFRRCYSLKNIPEDLFHYNKNVESFAECFCQCEKLETIPNKLFSECSKATNFGICFGFCNNLSLIPGDLFDNCQDATNFTGCFIYEENPVSPSKLKSIPHNLFSKNKKIQNISSCFTNQRNITITEDTPKLWDSTKWPEITIFNRCFRYCNDPNNIIPNDWKK